MSQNIPNKGLNTTQGQCHASQPGLHVALLAAQSQPHTFSTCIRGQQEPLQVMQHT